MGSIVNRALEVGALVSLLSSAAVCWRMRSASVIETEEV